MNVILRYIISLCILLALPFLSKAQKELERQVFIRAGFDLSRLTLPYVYDFGLSGVEMSLDGELKYRYFPVVEVGYNKINDNTDLHKYTLNGMYYRAGVNYNMVNYKHRFDRNLFFIGARYGFSYFSHQADEVDITNVWGTYKTNVDKVDLSANWFEGVIGMRAEIVKDFYIGYTIRVKAMISHTDYNNNVPFWVPGYGEGYKNMTMGFSYSVFYSIPIKDPKPDFEK